LVVEKDELEIVEGSLFVAYLVSWSFTLRGESVGTKQWQATLVLKPQGEGALSRSRRTR
jgi:hypothetical protein